MGQVLRGPPYPSRGCGGFVASRGNFAHVHFSGIHRIVTRVLPYLQADLGCCVFDALLVSGTARSFVADSVLSPLSSSGGVLGE